MQAVLKHIRERAEGLARHRLFTEWIERDDVEPRQKLLFMPEAIDFVMGFRDFNEYYVVYPEPADALERALTAHAHEDATHSRLFLEDWRALAIDDLLGWAPRDLYWWMTCEETQESRRLDFELISLVYHEPDPRLRFPIIESMEAAGHVFFQRTVPVVEALAATTGRDYPYFGRYHLERESGHLQNADERAFHEVRLSPAERARALGLVRRVFEIFERHFDRWERLARAIRDGRWDVDPRAQGRASADVRADASADVSRFMSLTHPADATGTVAELKALRQASFDALWDTPFHRWVREAWPGDFGRMVRYFLLQWVVDNWTCADYFVFDTPYAEPLAPVERGINRLSSLYASEMKRRYVEWETLAFDDFTGWTPAEALAHYWLDEGVEKNRRLFADLRKLTFRYPKPLHRYWILKCFVRFGDALMHSLGVAMRRARVADEVFPVFAGSPERLHPDLPPDPEADEAIARLERQPVCPEDERIIRAIVAETHRQEARRSDASWRVVQDGIYEPFDRRWQSRTRSDVAPAPA
ncbi:MAG TPA: hypothetical protein RMH99_17490 [Sandaracinaceae bacterium LLY-WYZ-13_1]|nr:hypothetical protein [Sandaracinaceae bacterium LLY-WYZ-13_1]